MNCRKAAGLFSDQIEGHLDRELSERLLAHLDRCPACAELLEIMELNITQLSGTPEPPMPSGLQQRLAAIPQRERAAARAGERRAGAAGGHWLFSNAAAAVILALFITANLTWFNPDFQESIHGCRRLISAQSAKALDLAADLGEDLNELKQQVESRMDRVRDAGEGNGTDTDDAEGSRSVSLVTDIIRALGLIGA